MGDFRQVIDLSQAPARHAAAGPRRGRGDPRPEPATRDQAGLGQPSAAYDVLGALSQAASRLPQALAQITSYLDQALAAGRLGHDLGEDPAVAIGAAVIFLGDARLSAAALAGDLDAAQQQLAPVNGRPAPQHKDQP